MVLTPPAARLLVLVPNGDLPVVELAQRIWSLAREAGSAVLLVGLAGSARDETETRKALAVLQSHTQYEAVPVSTRVARGPDWVTAVKQLRRPGDQVVVFADQQVPAGVLGWGNKPLAQALDEQLNVPAYIISDVALPRVPVEPRWASAARWAASLLIIIVGFAFMAWLQATVPGEGATSLQVLAVIGEFYLLARLQQRRP